jgi:hypothetical protein
VEAPVPLRLWHLTSLDAPTVAVTWTLAFAWTAHIRLPLWVPIVLALSAWTVYIADRLLDAYRAKSPLRPRHLFHWKHRRIFLPIAIVAAVIALTLILYSMPESARARNSVLAAAALVYFTSVHSPWRLPRSPAARPLHIPKELLVGILFTLACAVPTWARIPAHRTELIAPIFCFTALAWLNCHAIESWESASSIPMPRFVSPFQLAAVLAGLTLLSAITAAALYQPRIAAMFATAGASATLLASLDHYRHRLAPIALRAAADLVLLTPLALIAIGPP